MSLPRFLTALATALALVLAHTAFAAPGPEAANALQQQQLQDTLELNLQQSTPGTPANMSPADAQQLNELQLSQHMQQQQLDQQQLMQQQLALQPQRIGPNLNGQGALQQQQRQQFAEERQLQLQQFNTQQQQLMNTIEPQPLQPLASPGLLP